MLKITTKLKITIIAERDFEGSLGQYDMFMEFEHRKMIFKNLNIVLIPQNNISGKVVNHFQVETELEHPITMLDLCEISELLYDLQMAIANSNLPVGDAEQYIKEKIKEIFED